jgi:UDPglucose--hexose-1-phosphate uridylyltransferase
MKRPWQGQTESPQPVNLPDYDPKCYLCPGNDRADGTKNEDYEQIFVFENDYAAVLPPPGPLAPPAPHPLFKMEPVQGGCDVLIFHRRHDLTLARFSLEDINKVIEEWCKIYLRRGRQEGIKYVQIFEVRSRAGFLFRNSNPSAEQRCHDGLF